MAVQCSDRLRIEDWDVAISLSWDVLERSFVGRADLYLDNTLKCRIGLSREFETADDAAEFLKRSTRRFIDDWQRRVHTADSEFSEL